MAKINYVTMANFDEHFQYVMSVDEKRDVGVSQTEQAYDNISELLQRGFNGESITLTDHVSGSTPVYDVVGTLDDVDEILDAADIAESELDSMAGSEHLSTRQKDVVRSGVQQLHKQSIADQIQKEKERKLKEKFDALKNKGKDSKDGNGGEPPKGNSSPPSQDASK